MRGALVRIGEIEIDRARWDWNEVDRNPSSRPTPRPRRRWETYLDGIRKAGSSVGAVIEVVADGVPAGLGAPIYGKLDQDIAAAHDVDQRREGRRDRRTASRAARLRGEENADEMRAGNDGRPVFLSNNAGGILGGISTGPADRRALRGEADVVDPDAGARASRARGEDVDLVTKGRHDPCVGIRAVPVGEAMLAIVLADHYLRHRAQMGG